MVATITKKPEIETAGIEAPRLLTTQEAADSLSISTRTLWSLTNSGEMPSIRIGRALRYDPADLKAYIDRNRTGGKG